MPIGTVFSKEVYLVLTGLCKRCGVGAWTLFPRTRKGDILPIVDRETLGVRELFRRLPLLIASRGEFDLDLGAEGVGDFFERW